MDKKALWVLQAAALTTSVKIQEAVKEFRITKNTGL